MPLGGSDRFRFNEKCERLATGLPTASSENYCGIEETTMIATDAQGQAIQNLGEVEHCPICGAPVIRSPILQCAHCGKEVALRCLAYSLGQGRYIAECIDLDLLSQGNTREQAIGRLQEAMFTYLSVAFDGKSTKGLVLRRSPFSHRLRYYFQRMVCCLRYPFGRKHLVRNNKYCWNLHFSHC
jgi:hypothetical protein